MAQLFIIVAVLWSLLWQVLAADTKEEPELMRCKFTLEGRQFNLCPLFEKDGAHKTIERHQSTPPTFTTTTYRMSFHGSLRRNESLQEDEQCDENAWICMTMSYTKPAKPSQPPRILQVIPVAGAYSNHNNADKTHLHISAALGVDRSGKQTEDAIVTMGGGMYVDKYQSAAIIFHCDTSVEEPSNPAYWSSWNGTHYFFWNTKHACAHTSSPSQPDPPSQPKQPEAPETPSEPEPPETPEKDGEQLDLVLPPGSYSSFWRVASIVLASLTGTVFLCYAIIARSPFLQHLLARLRLRFTTSVLASKHRRSRSAKSLLKFRVGERRLMRWAQEDMALLGEDEEGTMVNGELSPGTGGAAGMVFEDDGEEMPLTPTPGYTKTYGSAG